LPISLVGHVCDSLRFFQARVTPSYLSDLLSSVNFNCGELGDIGCGSAVNFGHLCPLPGSASRGPSVSLRLEDLVHDLGPGRDYWPQFAPVDNLSGPGACMPGQPRNLFDRHALVTHHADERDQCRLPVSLTVARLLLDGRNRTLW
jgi:hypothetical protein